MKYEEFDQQIREMIPQPSAAITDALYRMGVEALEDRPQDLLIAFEFISRYLAWMCCRESMKLSSMVLPYCRMNW
mgnify:FL=1